MRTDYRQAIVESEEELAQAERALRGQAGQARVRIGMNPIYRTSAQVNFWV